jgi:hypothetical protein
VLRICPELTIGVPPLDKPWEPFQKYIGSPGFRVDQRQDYEFPSLEEISGEPRIVEPTQLLRKQLALRERKLLIIVGAPGTGKSRLLAEIAHAVLC